MGYKMLNLNSMAQVLGRVNLVTGHVKTQLIAHDKEVYDIAFSRAGGGRDMFASVGEFHMHIYVLCIFLVSRGNFNILKYNYD
jgi:hypothetical protein